MLLTRIAVLAALVPITAFAQRETTRGALSRLEETLTLRLEEGTVNAKDLLPAIVVSVAPAYEESRAWFPTAALAALVRVFGAAGLRSCEACMTARLYVENGQLEQNTTNLGTVEITRLDEATRGSAAAARTAIWLEETPQGVSLRIIDLQNSRIVAAENFDPRLGEPARSKRSMTLARELDRRTRGESVTHTFFDVGFLPHQHISLDWLEQWGDTNANLSGLTISFYDPWVGIGASYFRVIPQAWNLMVGVQLLVSTITAVLRAVAPASSGVADFPGLDPLFTGVLMLRLPIFSTNYAIVMSLSTNAHFAIGISMMNFSLLPFLP